MRPWRPEVDLLCAALGCASLGCDATPSATAASSSGAAASPAAPAIAPLAPSVATAQAAPSAPSAAEERVLRVCADPNNLPFSNEREEGFENQMAKVIAEELDARVEYTWWAQGRGFFRNTINARRCDLVMGVPKGIDFVDTTDAVYRSSYVFVSRPERGLELRSFDDEALRGLKIGVHVIGDDYTNTPPAHALARRGLIDNVVGYRINGDYAQPNPPARLVEAVARGEVDVAVVWGPTAGYFAARQSPPLRVARVALEMDADGLSMAYDIALGVRRREPDFKAELNHALSKRRAELSQILASYSLPLAER